MYIDVDVIRIVAHSFYVVISHVSHSTSVGVNNIFMICYKLQKFEVVSRVLSGENLQIVETEDFW